MLTCIIRDQIDPTKKAHFEEYSRNWGQAIPRCGADLVGYFAPHEGSSTLAYGIYNVKSLAEYEAYLARLSADPLGRENYEFAQGEILAARGPHMAQARFWPAWRWFMIAVIFEVEPAEGRKDEYLDIAFEDTGVRRRSVESFSWPITAAANCGATARKRSHRLAVFSNGNCVHAIADNWRSPLVFYPRTDSLGRNDT